MNRPTKSQIESACLELRSRAQYHNDYGWRDEAAAMRAVADYLQSIPEPAPMGLVEAVTRLEAAVAKLEKVTP